MTYNHNSTLPHEWVEQIAEQGFDYLPELIRIMINAAMQAERQKYLGVGPYERSPERRDYANGYKPCQFTDVNAPPLFGNTAPAICGRDAPLGEQMQKQSGWKFKVRSAWSAPPRVVSCGPESGRKGRG